MSTTTVRTTCTLDALVNCGPYTALDQLGVTCSDVNITPLVVEVTCFYVFFYVLCSFDVFCVCVCAVSV